MCVLVPSARSVPPVGHVAVVVMMRAVVHENHVEISLP